MKIKNIYIIGRVIGSYRTQNLIKLLLDKNYNIYYNSTTVNIFKDSVGVKKILRYLVRGVESILQSINRIYNILISDFVILPAMNNQAKHLWELRLANFLNKYIYTDFYISHYDTKVYDKKIINKNSKKARKLKNCDKEVINLSKKVSFLNTTETEYYLNLLDLEYNQKKHFVIPLCVDSKLICDLPFYTNNFNSKKFSFNICWWGNYLPLHGLKNIIDGFKELLETDSGTVFHLYLFGNSESESKKYLKYIKDLNIEDKITIFNNYTFSNGKLSDFLKNECDLVLGNFGNNEKAKNVIVNKLIDGVAMKAPVLNGESKAPHEFFDSDTIFYSQNDPSSIANKILEISNLSNQEIQDRVEKAFEVYENYFSESAYYKNINKLLID